MRRLKAFYRFFKREPLWYRAINVISSWVSIVLSTAAISLDGYEESVSKQAVAIFFGTFGINMRRNKRISLLFFVLAGLCLYLSWDALP
ncbi:hypothetical protein BK120_08785 [Paenibacillus sp. FSL A5-0031]|uniref:hypothetical protein n=1 Tax=Paenibacillus sp. FSL A5-0031 TaxID=1920420 RepID=UPI00096D98D2|nr:hypothetical protein [Paenibacillus sp. FSL A5-0031]OME86076.1 hypothetical protein BK120_08785 [Paenibacillus sp. FSL A5-0031]